MTVTSRGLIVLAEDQDSLRKLYRDVLEAHGFSVFTANNGEQAIQLCTSNTPKLVVLDIMMPGEDGLSLCILGVDITTSAKGFCLRPSRDKVFSLCVAWGLCCVCFCDSRFNGG